MGDWDVQVGSSFNTYNPATRQWHQTWVDSTGGFLLLDGAFAEGRMTLAGDMHTRRGVRRHRITFTPRDRLLRRPVRARAALS